MTLSMDNQLRLWLQQRPDPSSTAHDQCTCFARPTFFLSSVLQLHNPAIASWALPSPLRAFSLPVANGVPPSRPPPLHTPGQPQPLTAGLDPNNPFVKNVDFTPLGIEYQLGETVFVNVKFYYILCDVIGKVIDSVLYVWDRIDRWRGSEVGREMNMSTDIVIKNYSFSSVDPGRRLCYCD